MSVLEFEKPLVEIEKKIQGLQSTEVYKTLWTIEPLSVGLHNMVIKELCLSALKKVKLQKKTLSTILVCHNLKDIEKLLDFFITQTSLICQS